MSSPIQTLTRWASMGTGSRPFIPPLSLATAALWRGGANHTEELVSSPSSSLAINKLLDGLVLLSPRTWYGIFLTQTQSPFNTFDGIALIQSLVLGTLVPWLILAYGFHKFGSIRQREFLWKTITPVVWLSPWTMSTIYAWISQCLRLVSTLRFYWNGRMEAFPSAIHLLQERVQQGKVTRYRRYDVYWPSITTTTNGTSTIITDNDEPSTITAPLIDAMPSNTNTTTTAAAATTAGSLQQAILIVPGLGVSHVAYSEVASRLADAGILTVVVSMEPCRFAHKHLGADAVSMTRIMKRVQTGGNHHPQQKQKRYEWNVLGHSAGAFAAMHLYQQFQQLKQEQQQQTNSTIPHW